jgi:hypothetical protein
VSVTLSFLVCANQASAKRWITVPCHREGGLPEILPENLLFSTALILRGYFSAGLFINGFFLSLLSLRSYFAELSNW